MVACLVCATAGGAVAGPQQEFVVVREGVALHQQPSARSAKAKISDKTLLRFVARRGAWVQVQLVRTASHCLIGSRSQLGLMFFVRARDITPVATQEVTRRYAGGASITIGARAALWEDYQLRAVPPARRALRFRLGASLGPAPKGRVRTVLRNAAVQVGGSKIEVSMGSPVVVLGARRGRTRIYVRHRCWAFSGWVPSSAFRSLEEELSAMVGIVGKKQPNRADQEKLWLLANSPLSWRNGKPAGISYSTIEVTENVHRVGGLACTTLRPGSSLPAAEVCFAPSSLARSKTVPKKKPTKPPEP